MHSKLLNALLVRKVATAAPPVFVNKKLKADLKSKESCKNYSITVFVQARSCRSRVAYRKVTTFGQGVIAESIREKCG